MLRVLKLEQERGHDNSSVIGGLDNFVARWQAEEKSNTALRTLSREGLIPANYAALSATSRAEWTTRVITTLGVVPAKPRGAQSSKGGTSKPAATSGRLHPDAPASSLRAATSRYQPALERMGIERVRDLLYLFPRRHNQVRAIVDAVPDEEQAIAATVWEARATYLGRSMQGTEAIAGDDTGNLRIVWFNNRYVARRLKAGSRYIFSGRVAEFRGNPGMESPDFEEVTASTGIEQLARRGHLFPVYPLTEGIYQSAMRRIVREALARSMDSLQDTLPPDMRQRNELMSLGDALWKAHYPDDQDSYAAARKRIAFEELLCIQLGVLAHRKSVETGVKGISLRPPDAVLETFLGALPFELTTAQDRVLGEVMAELAGDGAPMGRLLQGEVGSGKTVIALAALLVTSACGYQGAIMAPTEVLAEQHFLTVERLLQPLMWPRAREHVLTVYLGSFPRPINVALLIGSTSNSRKDEIRDMLRDGSLDIVIGTHALIQEEVRIPKLALAVVDEQHRFGVLQRAALRGRGTHPHLLVMSATPIPRTLALTLYGDLDLSTLDELPPGRQRVRTRYISPGRRPAVYDFIHKQAEEGRQTFIIYPLIDESEAVNARAAVTERERLARDVFPDLRVGLLHGRMGTREKEEVMERFRRGETDILVSTPVVEVGIDVSNATVMLIEGADRFGLSQLHQFRGRVGRGEHPSYCILSAEAPSEEAKRRLEAMEATNDGFELAESDLRLRGPGDYFGTRQSGLPDLRMARLSDAELLYLARREATGLLERDPGLEAPEHAPLKAGVARCSPTFASEIA